MHWDDFDIFCQVVAQGSFSAAARNLKRPKSTVSAAVARLEEALQVRLLERSTRRIRVTEAGAALYDGAAPPLERLREVASRVQEAAGAVAGVLRIAAPYEFGAHHLGAVACRMMARHPDLRIVLDVVHASIDLFDRDYDILFSMTDRELADSSIVATRVFTLERGLFAAPGLLAGGRTPAHPHDLAAMPLLAGVEDAEWRFGGEAGSPAIAVPVRAPRLRSANAGVRKQAALAGVGIARITATYCAEEVADGRLCRLLPEFRCADLRVYALLPARRFMPVRVRAFLDTLSEMTAGAGAAAPPRVSPAAGTPD